MATQASSLPGCVFLSFDDFSRAGKRTFASPNRCINCISFSSLHSYMFPHHPDVLHFARVDGAQALPVPQATLEALLPAELRPFVQIYQFQDNQTALVTVATTELLPTQRWEVADALVSALSRSNVQQLTILAALHLPYAKDSGLNVFYSGLTEGAAADEVDVAKLARADPTWEVKDPWLAALLHLLKVEQWPRTHLLLAKGYKPSRDLSGTYDAVDALSRALQLFTKDRVTVDSQEVQRDLPRLLAKEKRDATAGGVDLTLLYH
jgi:hypothetical protein